MTARIFIDGEAGTTGLLIRERLAGRSDLRLLSIEPERRKDAARRAELLNDADIVVLCLPDDAAREAVGLIANPAVRVVDASSAHRVDPAWTYGFPEMDRDHTARVAKARLVSNPGCYPTGAVALLRPLVSEGVIPASASIHVNAVSGYSGGGRQLIARFEDAQADNHFGGQHFVYGLNLAHKHVPEMHTYGRLERRPLFVPAVGRFRQGMIVQIPLHVADLASGAGGGVGIRRIHDLLADWYGGRAYVRVAGLDEAGAVKELDPEAVNGSNLMRLYVFGSQSGDQILLAAVLDNLGKGASGAAVQNINLMLGLAESAGLESRLAA